MDVIKKADLPPHLSPLDILHAFRFILLGILLQMAEMNIQLSTPYFVLTLIFNQVYYSVLNTESWSSLHR